MLNLVVLLEADRNCFDDQRNSHHHENSSDIEAKKMGLNENDVVFSLECLVDVAVALASMEERLKKETMRLKEGLKNIDNAIKLSDFSMKPLVISDNITTVGAIFLPP
ncbi:hypothetical protein J1N35_025041 [Gossypium stocksii]|uniref:Uncharacterized protein n=1 Tax=Gossypium stocksii TaxID=47602 RepID=A0A9D3V6U2_9ROSI|nr:hypothetical protein J1N35_025041 [Gossypium stocksii]